MADNQRYRAILFADDHQKHLDRVREAFRGQEIELKLFRYTRMDASVERFRTSDYRSTLLAAAYRYHMHWTALIGERVAQTMPYKWWKQFNTAAVAPEVTVADPLPEECLRGLYDLFPDFRMAYDEDGMKPTDFARYGASVHTLNQFLGGYHKLLELVRERMLSTAT